MSIISFVFFILLCFSSMHANSEARYTGLRRSLRALFPHSDKGQFLVVEKLRLGMDSSAKGSVLVKQQDDEIAGEQKGTQGGADVSSITTTKGIIEYEGSEIFESSSSTAAPHMGLHKDKATTTSINKESRRGLYAKERQPSYEVEDDNDGVVLEDYKPPHETPPIHNKRT